MVWCGHQLAHKARLLLWMASRLTLTRRADGIEIITLYSAQRLLYTKAFFRLGELGLLPTECHQSVKTVDSMQGTKVAIDQRRSSMLYAEWKTQRIFRVRTMHSPYTSSFAFCLSAPIYEKHWRGDQSTVQSFLDAYLDQCSASLFTSRISPSAGDRGQKDWSVKDNLKTMSVCSGWGEHALRGLMLIQIWPTKACIRNSTKG